jgi:hypothetical protein
LNVPSGLFATPGITEVKLLERDVKQEMAGHGGDHFNYQQRRLNNGVTGAIDPSSCYCVLNKVFGAHV